MEKGVWVCGINSPQGGGIDIKRIFDREEDALLFVSGADASYGSKMEMIWYPIYQHGTQPPTKEEA